MAVIPLRTELESKFHPNNVGEIAVNNLNALNELLTKHELTGMTIGPKKADGTYGAGDSAIKTWYKQGDPAGAPGIGLVVDSLIKLLAILDDGDPSRTKVQDILRAFSHMGLADIPAEATKAATATDTPATS